MTLPLAYSTIAKKLLTGAAATGLGALTKKAITPKVPSMPDAPTIDEGRQARQETDRIRRRRGALANIAGGNSSAAPTVGTRTLLGG